MRFDFLNRLQKELSITSTALHETIVSISERVNRKVQILRLHWQASTLLERIDGVTHDLGQQIAGLKAGLTPQAKMKQMNVAEPVFGYMLDSGAFPDGGEIPLDRFIAPRIEAEIAFVTHTELRGPGVHIAQVLAATEFGSAG